jgi:recombination protein RecT
MTESSGQLVKVADKIKVVGQWLQSDSFVDQLRLALPSAGITPERLARIALTEVRRNPKLADCSIESLMSATMSCAMYGLEPGPMGFCFIIPYGKEASFQTGYKGLLQLAWKSEMLESVQAGAVYPGDGFKYSRGIPLILSHEPSDEFPEDDTTYSHVYGVVGVKGGGHICECWTRAQVIKHRDQFSQAYRNAEKYKKYNSPWHTSEVSMAKKSVLIQALKLAPMSTQLASLVAMEQSSSVGVPLDVEIDLASVAEEIGAEPVNVDTGEVGDPLQAMPEES